MISKAGVWQKISCHIPPTIRQQDGMNSGQEIGGTLWFRAPTACLIKLPLKEMRFSVVEYQDTALALFH
jgi:hypothetical protein